MSKFTEQFIADSFEIIDIIARKEHLDIAMRALLDVDRDLEHLDEFLAAVSRVKQHAGMIEIIARNTHMLASELLE